MTFNRILKLAVAGLSPLIIVMVGCTELTRTPNAVRSAEVIAAPAHVAQAGLELSAGPDVVAYPGNAIYLTHTLTNTGTEPDIFKIDASTSVTWSFGLLSADALTGTTLLSLTVNPEMSTSFYLSLTVPDNSSVMSGTLAPWIVTATSQLSPTVFATATTTVMIHDWPIITHTLFVPTITKDGGVKLVDFGVDFSHRQLLRDTSIFTSDLPLAKELGANWSRAWLPWAMIETSPGQYDWSWADLQLNRFAEEGFKTLAVVYYPPSWAAMTGCGPISGTAALDQFMTALLNRYGHLVDAWEFINEPDGRTEYPAYGPVIGCWGQEPKLYAERLAFFHDKVKALDPTALVVMGGLAYDNWAVFEREFITGTLQAGAGQYFDVLSLHFYPVNPQDFPTMAHKIEDIQSILLRHGALNKLIWITETSMWTNFGLAQQLNFIVQEQTRGFCAGADKLFWFAVREEIDPPQLKRWLINLQHQPDQGYYTYQHYASRLKGTFCRGRYTQVPAKVEAYEFDTPTGRLYILWTSSGTVSLSLPAASAATLIDRDGQSSQTLTAASGLVHLAVTTKPMFVVIDNL